MSLHLLWRELRAEHRRWVLYNAILVPAFINLLLNAGIGWLSVRSEQQVPLWALPLLDKPSTITDTVGTLFFLPLITCLLVTTAVRREMRSGRLPPLSWMHPLLGWLPATRLRRGLALGGLCTAALAPLSVLVLVMIDFGRLTVGEFVLYKAIFAVVLGVIVTPVIAVLAMTDAPPRSRQWLRKGKNWEP